MTTSHGQPEGKPAPYWKGPDDWYEFFRFTCPGCNVSYIVDHGADFPLKCNPRPVAIQSRWEVGTAKVEFSAVVVCTCMVRFEASGTS